MKFLFPVFVLVLLVNKVVFSQNTDTSVVSPKQKPAVTVADSAQKIKAPDNIRSSFSNQFPEISSDSVKWGYDKGKYSASFKNVGKGSIAYYSLTGDWLQTFTVFDRKELPFKINKFLERRFKNYSMKESVMIEDSQGTSYMITLSRGKDIQVMEFDDNGRLIKKRR